MTFIGIRSGQSCEGCVQEQTLAMPDVRAPYRSRGRAPTIMSRMNRHSLVGPVALLFLVAACGEESARRSEGEDLDGGNPHGEDDAMAEDAMAEDPNANDAGSVEPTSCSKDADCKVLGAVCQRAECVSGKCEVSPQSDGFPCDDQDACSRTDQCMAGQCTGSDRVECVASDACHDVGSCDPTSGACSTPMKSDGAQCSAAGRCEAGECLEAVVLLARQDFELTPATPAWNFTGEPVYRDGYSAENAAPAQSAIGIGGSRAWEATAISGGVAIDLDNVTIPDGFDSARLRFRLAAMNLSGSGGGPDNLDWVLVSLSVDGGEHFYDRLRIRGAASDNSVWGYDATGVASVAHSPESETMLQPSESGLQTSLGYSTVEVTFDGSVTQVQVRLTARSSSSSDTWLIDDVELLAERDLELRLGPLAGAAD
jgi:hypothetical protein